MPFHEGELAVQERAGFLDDARRGGKFLRARISSGAQAFLATRRFAILASRAPDGAVWTSIVAGQLPFLTSDQDGRFLRIGGVTRSDDPISQALILNAQVGLVAIDFESRGRFRVNGRLVETGPDALVIQVEEAFGNCPKYIQAYVPRADGRQTPGTSAVTVQLSAEQAAWIGSADLLFVGTYHPVRGADASHRGGAPGFVRVVSPTELAWGDYLGNRFFQSLGNAAVQPRAGLLFLDPETGSTLQLTGTLTIDWSPEAASEIPRAERVLCFRIEQVVETRSAIPLRWILSEPSPFNPPAR
jgi:predicted pyridoxine 5'-phosphate oxidase superfamily flavin-nucleotide-binding protein